MTKLTAFVVAFGMASGLSMAGITLLNPPNAAVLIQVDQADATIDGHVSDLTIPSVRELWQDYTKTKGSQRKRFRDYSAPDVSSTYYTGDAYYFNVNNKRGKWNVNVFLIDFASEGASFRAGDLGVW